MDRSRIVEFIRGYEKTEESFQKSKIVRRLNTDGVGKQGNPYVRFLYSGRLSRMQRKLNRTLAFTPTYSYGVFLLSFGLMTLLLFFAQYYLAEEPRDVFVPLITGAVSAILAIPLLLSQDAFCEALKHVPPLHDLFFDFFCLRKLPPQESDVFVLKPHLTLPLGIVLAVVGFFTQPYYVIALIALLLFLFLSIANPEFPFLIALLSLPYLQLTPHPTLILCVLIGVAFLSYVRKVALGNRVFTVEPYDALLGFFVLFILISGIFYGGVSSLGKSALILVLTLGYVLCANLITNRRLADRAIVSISVSAVPVSLYGIYQYFFTDLTDKWSDTAFGEVYRGRITSTFNNPNVLATFLLVCAIFSFAYALQKRHTVKRVFHLLFFALDLFALILTFSRGAWIALLFGGLACLLIYFRRRPGILLILLAALPYSLFFLPNAVFERLLSVLNMADSSISYRLSIYRSSISMFADNLFLGVGIGEDAFSGAFSRYAEDAVTAPHSHNLFLEIGCEAGVFALIFFVLLLLFRARHLSSYTRYLKKSSVRIDVIMSAATLFALLIYGMTDYIFYNYSMYFLFLAVFGIGAATLRISKLEHEDRKRYHGEEISTDASVTDITIF